MSICVLDVGRLAVETGKAELAGTNNDRIEYSAEHKDRAPYSLSCPVCATGDDSLSCVCVLSPLYVVSPGLSSFPLTVAFRTNRNGRFTHTHGKRKGRRNRETTRENEIEVKTNSIAIAFP